MSPIITGIIGAIIAGAVSAMWLKRFPHKESRQIQNFLQKKYKNSINLCGIVAIAIFVLAIYLLKSGTVANHWNWGLTLIGGALGSPLIALSIPIAKGGHKFSEAHAALAFKNHSPVGLQLFCIIFGIILFISGIVGLALT